MREHTLTADNIFCMFPIISYIFCISPLGGLFICSEGLLTHLFFPGCMNLVGGLAHLEWSSSDLLERMGPWDPWPLLIWLGCLACFALARLSWSCLAVCLALPCLGRQQAS